MLLTRNERGMVVWRAPHSAPWSCSRPAVTPSACSAPARRRPAREEPGGNAGQHAPGPGTGQPGGERAPARRREEGPQEEGLGPAEPRSPGGTRTGGASPPPPPQLSGKTRPGAQAQASSFCPAHTPWPLPFPRKTRSGNQTLRRAEIPNWPVTPTRCLSGPVFGVGRRAGMR